MSTIFARLVKIWTDFATPFFTTSKEGKMAITKCMVFWNKNSGQITKKKKIYICHLQKKYYLWDIKKSRLEETHWRPQYASSETNMPHWRQTCLIRNSSKTNMPHRRPTIFIRYQHAWWVQSEFKHIYSNVLIFIFFWLIYIYWNNVRTLIRYVDLQWGMLVSDEAC